MLKITIPTPCHEDWNKMTPDEKGRHCSSCAKSVVDFTGMSDEEVKYFFLNKKEDERVCGRFKQTQLHSIVIELPQNIFRIQMPLWKKFLAACLVVFSTTLFSCETKIKDKVETRIETTDLTGLMVIEPDTVPVVPVCTTTVGYSVMVIDSSINELQGDIAIVDTDFVAPKSLNTIPVPQQKNEIIFMGDSIYEEAPVKKLKSDSLTKTKNPPTADSINCNTIKNYY